MVDYTPLGITFTNNNTPIFNEGNFSYEFLSKNQLITSNGKFYLYKDNHWKPLDDIDIKKLCKVTFDSIQKGIWKLSYESRYLPTLRIDASKIEPNDINKFPYRTNFENVVFNFKEYTKEIHNSLNYFTYIKKYPLKDIEEDTPYFDEMIELVSDGDKELKQFILELMAYLISGYKTEQKFFILKGNGKNGKSTFINLITKLIGTNFVSAIPLSKLGDRFTLSSAVDKKLIVASENESSSNKPISTEVLKQLTSGKELMRVEKKYENEYSTYLQTEILCAINNTIRFSETSDGLIRRVVVIPFNGVITSVDPTFEEELEKEIPNITKKLIDIYENIYNRKGKLCSCLAVDSSTKNLLFDNKLQEIDKSIIQFYNVHIKINFNGKVIKKHFFNKYIAEKGQLGETKFWVHLKKYLDLYNIKYVESRNQDRFIQGISLKEVDNSNNIFNVD